MWEGGRRERAGHLWAHLPELHMLASRSVSLGRATCGAGTLVRNSVLCEPGHMTILVSDVSSVTRA